MPRKKSGLFDQSKYVQQFMKDKVTVKKVSFNREKDADLIEWLKDKTFSAYVKQLIRRDIREESPMMVNVVSKIDVRCPSCGYNVDHNYKPARCEKCGQLLSWETYYL